MYLGDTLDPGAADPKKIAAKLHARWGHASVRRLKWFPVDADGDSQRLLGCVSGVLGPCEVCRASEEAPHLPVAGTSAAPPFNEKLQVVLLSVGGVGALHAMDMDSLRARAFRESAGRTESAGCLEHVMNMDSLKSAGCLHGLVDCGFWQAQECSDG